MNDLWKFDGTYWTWISGKQVLRDPGAYGRKGIPSISNLPPSREASAYWTDSSDNFWIFGGLSTNESNIWHFNDLWKFDGTNWTWISGQNFSNAEGEYGIKGVDSISNCPRARSQAIPFKDSKNNLWLFGGRIFSSDGSSIYAADLWKFDGERWMWVAGPQINDENAPGEYGIKGVPSASSYPPGRSGSAFWTDSNDNFWIYGGDSLFSGSCCYLDLWRFNGENWTWIYSADSAFANHGQKEVVLPSNHPGMRFLPASWIDSEGRFWMFGGYTDYGLSINDLWMWNGEFWIWMDGNDYSNDIGEYGEIGVPSSNNIPPSGADSSFWIDSFQNLWLFGGYQMTNDLWKCTFTVNLTFPATTAPLTTSQLTTKALTTQRLTTSPITTHPFVTTASFSTTVGSAPIVSTTDSEYYKSSSRESTLGIVVGISVGVLASIVGVVLFVVRRRKIMLKHKQLEMSQLAENSTAPLLTGIEIKHKLGGGNFGEGLENHSLLFIESIFSKLETRLSSSKKTERFISRN